MMFLLQFILVVATLLSSANPANSVPIRVDNPATNLTQLVSDCSTGDTITASGSGSADSPTTNTACVTLDILLYTDLLLDSPVTFLDLNYTSIQGEQGIATITCTSADAGLVFTNTRHVELRAIKLVGCAVLGNHYILFLSAFSSAVHIVQTQYVSVSNVNIESSPGAGMFLIDNTGITNVTDSNFIGNKLPQSAPRHIHGGGGVFLHIESTDENNQFYFDNCTFKDNIAENTRNYTYLFVDELGDPVSGRGRGGGLFVNIRSNVVNNSVIISNCIFENNMAFLGNGLGAEIEHANTHNNSILIRKSEFLQNGCQEGGKGSAGGGVQLSFRTLKLTSNRDNIIKFQDVLFRENCALLGGGIYFYSNLNSDPDTNNQLVFENCTWEKNHASLGSAVDLTPDIFERLDSGHTIFPVFRDCVFIKNSNKAFANANTSLDHFGTATFYSSLYDIRFESSVIFSHNFGTAVHVVNSLVDFTKSNALFHNNVGTQGGGVALIGTSSMLIGPYNYTFTNNVATDRGGAIYSHLVDNHDFVVSRSCFIQYSEERLGSPSAQIGIPSTQWMARVYFEGNLANSKQGHDIFTTSLLPCQVVIIDSEYVILDSANIFQPPGVTFAGLTNGLRISTDGAGFTYSTSHLEVIPGENFVHGINMLDDLDQLITGLLSASLPLNRSDIELDDSIFLTDQAIKFRGKPHDEDILVLQTVNTRKIFLTLDVQMLNCPPGFTLLEDHCVCDAQSHFALVRCDETSLRSYLKAGYWAGYVNNTNTSAVFASAICPLGFCNYNSKQSELEVALPNSKEDLEGVICGVERSGILCGRCNPGYAVCYHSPSLQCVAQEDHCNYLGWLFYILSEIIPATVLFIVILVFNINFTSGALNGFILFSQVLDTLLIDASGVIVLPDNIKYAIDAIRLVYGFFNLDFFYLRSLSFCIWKEASVLDILAFKYLTIVYSVFLIAGVIVFMKYCGARCLGKYYRVSVMRISVIKGLSTFLVMCYAQCVKVSFSLLYSGTLYASPADTNSSVRRRVLYNGDIEYFSVRHLPYALPALAVLLTIGIIPPAILLTYPAIFRVFRFLRIPDSFIHKCLLPFNTLKPFLDAFQGSFRDNFRFFAGIYFLYRWVGVLIYTFSTTYGIFYAVLDIALVLILVLHALAQPYRKKWHNVLDTFILLDLALINNLTAVHYYIRRVDNGLNYRNNIYWISILQVILAFLPMLYLAIYQIAQISKRTCCKKQSVREKYIPNCMRRTTSNEEEYDLYIEEDLPYRLQERPSVTTLSIGVNDSLHIENIL